MSMLTFLGTGGGCGTTTLAALSAQLIAHHAGRVPTLIAEDSEAFAGRLGELPPAAHASDDQLCDSGRYSAVKAATALNAGLIVVVGAVTPQGIAALGEVIDDIGKRFGQAGLNRTLPVQCAAFGAGAATVTDPRTFRLPFDISLAPGGPASDALPRLRAGTERVLRSQWLPVLTKSYGIR